MQDRRLFSLAATLQALVLAGVPKVCSVLHLKDHDRDPQKVKRRLDERNAGS